MSNTELEHLIKMANEIAANLARGDTGEAAAERVADHLKRFWAPAMRQKLIDCLNSTDSKLEPACRIAIRRLAESKKSNEARKATKARKARKATKASKESKKSKESQERKECNKTA